MTFDSVYWDGRPLIEQLHDAADECLDNIDGADESLGSDSRWSRYHDPFLTAALVLEKHKQNAESKS